MNGVFRAIPGVCLTLALLLIAAATAATERVVLVEEWSNGW